MNEEKTTENIQRCGNGCLIIIATVFLSLFTGFAWLLLSGFGAKSPFALFVTVLTMAPTFGYEISHFFGVAENTPNPAAFIAPFILYTLVIIEIFIVHSRSAKYAFASILFLILTLNFCLRANSLKTEFKVEVAVDSPFAGQDLRFIGIGYLEIWESAGEKESNCSAPNSNYLIFHQTYQSRVEYRQLMKSKGNREIADLPIGSVFHISKVVKNSSCCSIAGCQQLGTAIGSYEDPELGHLSFLTNPEMLSRDSIINNTK